MAEVERSRRFGTSAIDWRATFTPVGAPEADVVEVVAGIFEGGLDAL